MAVIKAPASSTVVAEERLLLDGDDGRPHTERRTSLPPPSVSYWSGTSPVSTARPVFTPRATDTAVPADCY